MVEVPKSLMELSNTRVINGIETPVTKLEPTWLPAVTCRPVLPLEKYTFRVYQPCALAAVQLSWNLKKPLAALAAMPAREGKPGEQLGVALELEDVVELAGGGLEVSSVGSRPFRVIGRNVTPCRVWGAPALSKTVSVEWLQDKATVTSWECVGLREHVLSLLRDAQDSADCDHAELDLGKPFF